MESLIRIERADEAELRLFDEAIVHRYAMAQY
jgi:hypothetical protein